MILSFLTVFHFSIIIEDCTDEMKICSEAMVAVRDSPSTTPQELCRLVYCVLVSVTIKAK